LLFFLSLFSDHNLPAVLALADEYQVDGLISKCRNFLRYKLLKLDQLTVDDTLQYLILCDRYRFDDLKDRLIQKVESAGISQHKIVESWFYDDVDSKLMRDILHKKLNQATATIAQAQRVEKQPCGRCNYSINSGCGTHVEQLKAATFDIGQLENIMDLCTPVVLSFLRQTLISCNLSWL
jgi:hypothetical protein